MLFWITILLLLFVLGLQTQRSIFWYIFSIGSLVFIAGFRAISVGTDTYPYSLAWQSILIDGNSYMEIGWNSISNFVAFFTNDYNLYLSFISLFTIGIAGYVWHKYSSNAQLSLFIYFAIYAYCGSLNIMRQYAAISVLLLAYTFTYHHKMIICTIIILLASTIHLAALFALPAIFADKISLENKTFVCVAIVSTLIIGALPFAKELSIIAGKFGHYFNSTNLYRDDSSIFIIFSCIYSGLFLYIYFCCDNALRSNPMLKIYFIGIIMFNIICQLSLGTRIFYNFAIVQTLFLPDFFHKKKYIKVSILLSIYLLFYCTIMLYRNAGEVYPYINVFNKYF